MKRWLITTTSGRVFYVYSRNPFDARLKVAEQTNEEPGKAMPAGEWKKGRLVEDGAKVVPIVEAWR